jgi:hypothetical protein
MVLPAVLTRCERQYADCPCWYQSSIVVLACSSNMLETEWKGCRTYGLLPCVRAVRCSAVYVRAVRYSAVYGVVNTCQESECDVCSAELCRSGCLVNESAAISAHVRMYPAYVCCCNTISGMCLADMSESVLHMQWPVLPLSWSSFAINSTRVCTLLMRTSAVC